MLLLLCSPYRLSSVSVVFDFSASLNEVPPPFLMSLSIDLMRMEKSGLLTDFICVFLFLFTTQIEFCECCV